MRTGTYAAIVGIVGLVAGILIGLTTMGNALVPTTKDPRDPANTHDNTTVCGFQLTGKDTYNNPYVSQEKWLSCGGVAYRAASTPCGSTVHVVMFELSDGGAPNEEDQSNPIDNAIGYGETGVLTQPDVYDDREPTNDGGYTDTYYQGSVKILSELYVYGDTCPAKTKTTKAATPHK